MDSSRSNNRRTERPNRGTDITRIYEDMRVFRELQAQLPSQLQLLKSILTSRDPTINNNDLKITFVSRLQQALEFDGVARDPEARRFLFGLVQLNVTKLDNWSVDKLNNMNHAAEQLVISLNEDQINEWLDLNRQ